MCAYRHMCLSVCKHVHVLTYVYMHAYVHLSMHVCLYICVHVCVLVHVQSCACAYVCMHMCVCVWMCLLVCMCGCVCTCVFVYICVYMCTCLPSEENLVCHSLGAFLIGLALGLSWALNFTKQARPLPSKRLGSTCLLVILPSLGLQAFVTALSLLLGFGA